MYAPFLHATRNAARASNKWMRIAPKRPPLAPRALFCLLLLLTAFSPLQIPLRAAPQQSTASPNSQPPQPIDIAKRLGPFKILDQLYTVELREKEFLHNGQPPTSRSSGEETIIGLQIVDSNGNSVYQETIPFSQANGYFSQALTATASLLNGQSNSALVIRFVQQPTGQPGSQTDVAAESFQVFGSVKGQLKPLGPVLPLGKDANIAVGGVVTGVMVMGGINVEPLATTAEVLGFPAWAGSFYALVPVRMDWINGAWGEGEECYANDSGVLRERGCSMAIEAQRQPKGHVVFVRLYDAPNEDSYNSHDVEVRPDSSITYVGITAIVHWQSSNDRVECTFNNMWLHVRVDGHDGWVHDQGALDALGLARTNPE
jgi:hypothetical protein